MNHHKPLGRFAMEGFWDQMVGPNGSSPSPTDGTDGRRRRWPIRINHNRPRPLRRVAIAASCHQQVGPMDFSTK